MSDEPPMEGPPIPITTDIVKRAISQMKAGKALGPSGSVTSLLQSFFMAKYLLTVHRVSLPAYTRVRGDAWKGETNAV